MKKILFLGNTLNQGTARGKSFLVAAISYHYSFLDMVDGGRLDGASSTFNIQIITGCSYLSIDKLLYDSIRIWILLCLNQTWEGRVHHLTIQIIEPTYKLLKLLNLMNFSGEMMNITLLYYAQFILIWNVLFLQDLQLDLSWIVFQSSPTLVLLTIRWH